MNNHNKTFLTKFIWNIWEDNDNSNNKAILNCPFQISKSKSNREDSTLKAMYPTSITMLRKFEIQSINQRFLMKNEKT